MSRARSLRSRTVSAISAAFSVSPRFTQAVKAFSRRSRRVENCRKGSIEERDRVMTCLPARSRSRAASAAAERTDSGRPARSSSPSSTSMKPFSAASTFWLNAVPSSASRSLISASRFLPASSSAAPARSKMV